MRSICCPAVAAATAAIRMIWLPGAYHSAQDFLEQGFAAAVQKRGLPLDLSFVDLQMTHLNDRQAIEKLRLEAVLPARDSGVALWLGGISLGALAALDYVSTYPNEIDSLCLLAPYLGNRMLINEISAGLGLRGWQPSGLAEFDTERRIWGYIKRQLDSTPVFLGYGRQDRFSSAHDLMAAALPSNSVAVVAGGHDWPTWLTLWEKFLDSHFA